MKLSFEIIESYGFPRTITKPDWDDVQNNYTLPNGIELGTLTVCNNEPCSSDMLEGWDGFICIETKEELDELVKLTWDEVCEKINKERNDFPIDEYM
tara:strand:+ start:55534 stop:55824 length:291 start_codon:yes stop_codon:yes gene_type:complete